MSFSDVDEVVDGRSDGSLLGEDGEFGPTPQVAESSVAGAVGTLRLLAGIDIYFRIILYGNS